MKTIRNKYFLILLAILTMVLFSTFSAMAKNDDTGSSYSAYQYMVKSLKNPSGLGQIFDISGNSRFDYVSLPSKQYKTSGGGYVLYAELIRSDSKRATDIVNNNLFNQLTIGAKQDFVKDIFTIANAIAYASEHDSDIALMTDGADTDTINQLYTYLETKEGMGTVLMASIMENTKPNFAAANQIYAPFSGVIGTVLGLIAIVIMALLGVTMALDIAYIVIPTVQLILDSSQSNGGPEGYGGNKKGLSGLVSQAAKNAVQAASGGQGGQGQSGEGNKMALGVYFKYRWLELVVLGICLLYLVSGNIYSFVAWILDLVSGFIGF